MTAIVNIEGLGKACTHPGCDKETTYHGKKRTAPASHEVDGQPLCLDHHPCTDDPNEKVEPKPLRLVQVQILTVNPQFGNTEAKGMGNFQLLSQARRYASGIARDLYGAPRNRKVHFTEEGALYLDRNDNPVPIPMRIVETSLSVGDWVHVGLHNLAEEPDCYKADGHRCRHPHQQVGRIVRLYKNDVSGWVADVDFQPLTHRIAGGDEYPGGIDTLAVVVLEKITPHLRGWEILEGIRLTKHEEHCAGHVNGGKCMQPVLRIFYRWSDEMPGLVTIGQRNEDHHLDGIRHADGTGPWDHSMHWAFPRCQECGFEGESHCSKCHQGNTLKVTMEAYGNRTTCSTPGCGRDDFYDIGD